MNKLNKIIANFLIALTDVVMQILSNTRFFLWISITSVLLGVLAFLLTIRIDGLQSLMRPVFAAVLINLCAVILTSASYERLLSLVLPESYKDLSIVGEIRCDYGNQFKTVLLLVVLTLMGYLTLIALQGSEFSPAVPTFLAVLMIASYARLWLLIFRIRRGIYGGTEREAREIIKYIRRTNTDDGGDGTGRSRRLLSKRDLEDLEQGKSSQWGAESAG